MDIDELERALVELQKKEIERDAIERYKKERFMRWKDIALVACAVMSAAFTAFMYFK